MEPVACDQLLGVGSGSGDDTLEALRQREPFREQTATHFLSDATGFPTSDVQTRVVQTRV
jgi:hypothetical protein